MKRLLACPAVTCLGLALIAGWTAVGRGGSDGDSAAPPLNQELAEVAGGIKRLLDGRGQDTIAVGAFTGPERATASGGAGIKLALAEELKRAGVRVDKKADLEIKGDYFDAEDKQSNLLALVLKARVLDRHGTEINTLQRSLFDFPSIGAILGTTVQLPVGLDEKARDQRFREGLDHPQFQITGPRVSPPDSPYGIEVMVKTKSGYQLRAAERVDGLAFVAIQRDEIYAVKLINDSPYDAAVTLTIDGLSAFAFSQVTDPRTGRPRYSHFIVPARQYQGGVAKGGQGAVYGWHIKDDTRDPEGNTDQFKITEYPQSALAELGGSVGDIGTITASFAAAWPKGAQPPADEPDAARRNHGRSGDATGRGPRIGVKFAPVEEHAIGLVRATVSVRYTR